MFHTLFSHFSLYTPSHPNAFFHNFFHCFLPPILSKCPNLTHFIYFNGNNLPSLLNPHATLVCTSSKNADRHFISYPSVSMIISHLYNKNRNTFTLRNRRIHDSPFHSCAFSKMRGSSSSLSPFFKFSSNRSPLISNVAVASTSP